MAATSVKMDEATKSRLEELQAEIKLETGRKVSQQDLLSVLVDHAFSTKAGILDHFRQGWQPLTQEEIGAFHTGTVSSGAPVEEEEIDEVLYGDPAA